MNTDTWRRHKTSERFSRPLISREISTRGQAAKKGSFKMNRREDIRIGRWKLSENAFAAWKSGRKLAGLIWLSDSFYWLGVGGWVRGWWQQGGAVGGWVVGLGWVGGSWGVLTVMEGSSLRTAGGGHSYRLLHLISVWGTRGTRGAPGGTRGGNKGLQS